MARNGRLDGRRSRQSIVGRVLQWQTSFMRFVAAKLGFTNVIVLRTNRPILKRCYNDCTIDVDTIRLENTRE